MAIPLNLLIVEDSASDAALLILNLEKGGFELQWECIDTLEGLQNALKDRAWDLIISDYSMPQFSGLAALRFVRERGIDLPFILVSGSVGEDRAVEAMKAGAQDYIMKSSLTRLVPAIKRELEDAKLRRRQRQSDLELQSSEEKLRRLKRFFSPQIAEMAVSSQIEDPFKWHRKEVSVIFVDLRGFTSFVEVSEPEVVIEIVQEYYSAVGKVVQEFAGTIGHVAGDGIMIFLNDPIDVPDHQRRSVELSLKVRSLLEGLQQQWRQREHILSFGAGVASGYASIGGIGAEGCWDYSVIGTVANVASRLCSDAKDGQILISHRFLCGLGDRFETEPVGEIPLRGIHRPVATFNVLRSMEGKT